MLFRSANVIVAVIVYLSAFSMFFKGLMDAKKKDKPAPKAETAGKEKK